MVKNVRLAGVILLFAASLSAQRWAAYDIMVYDQFEDLNPTFEVSGDSVHVINFWATWCKPCVAELPYFEALLDDSSVDKLKLTLVSLDFKHQIHTKLLDFLNEHSIKANVVVLTDGNANKYINAVDNTWEGSIPATLIKYKDKRLFYERSFHSVDELKQIINSIK